MKVKCTIIEDLLPLYADGICSEDTKEMVAAHLRECPECSRKYKNMTNQLVADEVISGKEELESDFNKKKEEIVTAFTAKKAFKKLRMRMIAVLLIIIFLIPTIILGINQYDGEGISYTNMGVLFKTHRMLSQMKKGDYEKAFQYLDTRGKYQKLIAPVYMISLADTYQVITINSTDYYVRKEMLNYYQQYEDNKEELSFWRDIYLSNDYIIPADQYTLLLEDNPKISSDNVEEGYMDAGNGPELITSDYGNYYVPYHFKSSSASEDGNEILTAAAYLLEADIIPKSVFEAVLEQEKKDLQDQEKVRKQYVDMGYDQYYNSCKNSFISHMEKLSGSKIKIDHFKLKFIDRSEDHYQLNVDVIFKVNGVQVRGFGLVIMAYGNKLQLNSSYYVIGSEGEKLEEQYQLTSAFNVRV